MSALTIFQRTVARVLPIDVTFMLLLPPLFLYTLQVPEQYHRAVGGGMFLLIALRAPIWLYALHAQLAPLSAWARRPASQRTDGDLRAGLELARAAPTRFLMTFGGSYGVALALHLVWTWWFVGGADGLSPRFLTAHAFVVGTAVLGALALSYGLGRAIVADSCRAEFEAGEARNIPLFADSWTVRTRLPALAMCIAMTPLGWVGAIAIRAADTGAEAEALLRARLHVAQEGEPGATDADRHVGRLGDTGFAIAPTVRARVLADQATGLPSGAFARAGLDRAYAWAAVAGDVVVAETVISDAPATFFNAALRGFFIVFAVWGLLTAFILGREMGDGIARVTGAVERLVHVGDLEKMAPLPPLFDDEIGELTRHFNELIRTQRTLADGAARVADGDLSGQILGTGALPDAFRGMLEGLRALVQSLHQTSFDLAAAAAEIYSASQEQEASATQQSAAIVEVSRTMDSLASSSAHIAESVANVQNDADKTRATTEQMAVRIAELNSHAGRIGELLDVIREIADRSDLLALNGSLEATRAGEAGRGFGLVAGEMRRLAERVTTTVSDVRALLLDIRASGSATVMATEQSRKLAEGTSDTARRIALVTQQQRTATEQVTMSVRETAGVISQAATATTQTRVSAEQLKAQAEALENLLTRFRTKA